MLEIGQTRGNVTRISRDKAIELYKVATKAVKYETTNSVVFESGNLLVTVLNKDNGQYITTTPRSAWRKDLFECEELAYKRITLIPAF